MTKVTTPENPKSNVTTQNRHQKLFLLQRTTKSIHIQETSRNESYMQMAHRYYMLSINYPELTNVRVRNAMTALRTMSLIRVVLVMYCVVE